MLQIYARMVDKLIPPELEKKLRLGRRRQEDRRLLNKDRRNSTDENFRYSQSERRDSETIRRNPDKEERRHRWFRINSFQSRRFL